MLIFIPALVLLVSTADLCGAESVTIRSVRGLDGKLLEWNVSVLQLQKTPAWKFNESFDTPLRTSEAYRIAGAWLDAQVPGNQHWQLTSYGIRKIDVSDVFDRWYFELLFVKGSGESALKQSETSVLVLMDGTVIEPE